jgi:hypothetical protein
MMSWAEVNQYLLHYMDTHPGQDDGERWHAAFNELVAMGAVINYDAMEKWECLNSIAYRSQIKSLEVVDWATYQQCTPEWLLSQLGLSGLEGLASKVQDDLAWNTKEVDIESQQYVVQATTEGEQEFTSACQTLRPFLEAMELEAHEHVKVGFNGVAPSPGIERKLNLVQAAAGISKYPSPSHPL